MPLALIPQSDIYYISADTNSNVHAAGIAGTGFGLYLCRELIELHGGQIWFKSVEKVGSTFFLTLPSGEYAQAEADEELQGSDRVQNVRMLCIAVTTL